MKPPGLSGWSASGYAFKLGNAPKRPLSETQLVKHVLKALAMEPGVTAWRCQSGRRAGISFGLGKGAADVIACVGPYGRFLAIELKTKTGKQSEAQGENKSDLHKHLPLPSPLRGRTGSRMKIELATVRCGQPKGD